MRKFVSFGLIGMLVLSTLAVVPSQARTTAAVAAPTQGAGLVSSILNNMERNRRELKTLRAGVWMQKYNAQLRETDSFLGEVSYIPGQGRNLSLRVDWTKPTNEILSVTGGQYTLFKPRLNTAYRGSSASVGKNNKVTNVLGFGLNISKAELNAKFQPVELVGEGSLDGPHVWLLKLVPKGDAGYKFAEVWVDDNGMPLQVRINERNGDKTTVRIVNPQRNTPVDAAVFDINLPSDVKIVKG